VFNGNNTFTNGTFYEASVNITPVDNGEIGLMVNGTDDAIIANGVDGDVFGDSGSGLIATGGKSNYGVIGGTGAVLYGGNGKTGAGPSGLGGTGSEIYGGAGANGNEQQGDASSGGAGAIVKGGIGGDAIASGSLGGSGGQGLIVYGGNAGLGDGVQGGVGITVSGGTTVDGVYADAIQATGNIRLESGIFIGDGSLLTNLPNSSTTQFSFTSKTTEYLTSASNIISGILTSECLQGIYGQATVSNSFSSITSEYLYNAGNILAGVINTNRIIGNYSNASVNYANDANYALSALTAAQAHQAYQSITTNYLVSANNILNGIVPSNRIVGNYLNATTNYSLSASYATTARTTDYSYTASTSTTLTSAANIIGGTLSDSRLSSNVPLLDKTNQWSGSQRFNGRISQNIYNVNYGWLQVGADPRTTYDYRSLEDGQIMSMGVTSTNKRLILGYDSYNDTGYINAGRSGEAWTNLILQSAGGCVGIFTYTTPPTERVEIGTGNLKLRAGNIIVNPGYTVDGVDVSQQNASWIGSATSQTLTAGTYYDILTSVDYINGGVSVTWSAPFTQSPSVTEGIKLKNAGFSSSRVYNVQWTSLTSTGGTFRVVWNDSSAVDANEADTNAVTIMIHAIGR